MDTREFYVNKIRSQASTNRRFYASFSSDEVCSQCSSLVAFSNFCEKCGQQAVVFDPTVTTKDQLADGTVYMGEGLAKKMNISLNEEKLAQVSNYHRNLLILGMVIAWLAVLYNDLIKELIFK